MPTPTPQQARSHHRRQAAIAAGAAATVERLILARRPWSQTLAVVVQYQLAASTLAVRTLAEWAGSDTPLVDPRPFVGVSSAGFPVAEPLVSAVDAVVPAPVETLPAPWWRPTDAAAVAAAAARVVEGQIKDAARSAAGAELVARPTWRRYVRMLTPPSCKRCVVLAGRVYRDMEAFDRHPPTCDCIHVPTESWEKAHDAGLVTSPREAFEKGWVRGLSQADAEAIRDGADLAQVVNASQGITTADLFGRTVKATTASTTQRSTWRRQNPSRLVRLRPESIYRIADGDRGEALRLLRLYGYLT